MNDLVYAINKSTNQDVLNHLKETDEEFVPPLHTYVVISEYANKIAENATRFEIWRNGKLKGLAAGYLDEEVCYISNFSISSDLMGMRIGSKLLEFATAYCHEHKVSQISLEVRRENKKAISFYEREGFLVKETKAESFIYQKTL